MAAQGAVRQIVSLGVCGGGVRVGWHVILLWQQALDGRLGEPKSLLPGHALNIPTNGQ